MAIPRRVITRSSLHLANGTKAILLLIFFVSLRGSAQAAELIGPIGKQAAGGLEFDKEVFHYQANPADTQFTATFRVRNPGAKSVKITKLDSSCTCLSVKAERIELAPGGESVVTAVFNIPKHPGETEKAIVVTTDDPEVPVKRLTVKVTVPPIVEITPTITEWKVGEEPKPREIVFKVIREQPIRILEASSSRRQISLTVKTVEEGREYRLVLTPSSTDESLLGFVSIKTDCEIKELQRQMTYFKIN